MSIATRTGDTGETALMYGRRVSKTHPQVETYGTVDELNSALGMVRASTTNPRVQEIVLSVQKNLVALMGQLAVAPEDDIRYQHDHYPKLTPEMLAALDAVIAEIEAQKITFKGWATPGATVDAAALDLARTICRRAERHVVGLQEKFGLSYTLIIQYLNRLADVLWLLARYVETQKSENSISPT